MKTQTVVITGSTRGLGFAAARACLDAGANVVVCSEDVTDTRAAEQALGPGPRLLAMKCDMTVPADVEALVEQSVRKFGRIDVLINNAAASGVIGKTADVPIVRGRRVLATNILGTYYGSVCALRQMERQGGGRVINVVGRGARGSAPYSNLYGSTKAWVRAFTDNLRREYRRSGIEVGTFDPGLFYSTFTRDVQCIAGEESRVATFRKVIRAVGAPTEVPANELAALALSATPLSAASSSMHARVLFRRMFERIVLRRSPPFDPASIVPRAVRKESSITSN